MKKLNNLNESKFLKLLFAFVTVSLLAAAVAMPDREKLFTGLWHLWTQPLKITTNCFNLAGFAPTFLNMGIVGLMCLGIYCLPGAKANNVSTLAFLLTVGFAGWGLSPMNAWPSILGVALYCLVKKESLGANANAMLFSTGIAPLLSEILVRYPHVETVGFRWEGFLLAVVVGLIIGFFLPAALPHAPKVHKGFDHYSAALPIGMTAFFLKGVLFKVPGVAVAEAPYAYTLLDESPFIINLFCGLLFVIPIVAALLMGCKPKDYWNLMKDSGHSVSFTQKYGNAPMLMNFGVFGLVILLYYNLAGATFNAVTFGCILCMVSCCNSGSHPRNVWPIMLGYVVMSCVMRAFTPLVCGYFKMDIDAQAIVIGLCFANGLSPISGKYGWHWGALAGGLHYLLVTSVPDMHGGFCLYNGGLTAALICLLMVPQLERFCKTKEERKALKVEQ